MLVLTGGCHHDENGEGNDLAGSNDGMSSTDDLGDGSANTGDGGDGGDGGNGDGGPTVGLRDVDPGAASRAVSTDVTVSGFGIATGATITLVPCVNGLTVDGGSANIVISSVNVAANGGTASFSLGADNTRKQGLYSVELSNPDGSAAVLECSFIISALAPPTVTNVQPATAYRGAAGDGVLSDQPVTITGTGFEATPRVVLRQRLAGNALGPPVDAYAVSWVSATTLTAVIPSETDSMALGGYTVEVINPNLLQGSWANPFQIVDKAPPKIISINPLSSQMKPQVVTLCGTGFDATSATPTPTAYVIVPPGTTCAPLLNASTPAVSTDPVTGYSRCAIDIAGVPAACGGSLSGVAVTIGSYADGAYPIEWVNGDGQEAIFYNFSFITPAQPGHLKGCWESGYDAMGATACDTAAPPTLFPGLSSGRWRHGLTYDFDEFGNTYLFVEGGQAARTSAPLDTVEATQLDVFGRPGPWKTSLQFDPGTKTHVANKMVNARTGAPLVHLGAHLYVVGGSRVETEDSAGQAVVEDTAGTPGILKTTEHAFVLGYSTRPNAQRPQVDAAAVGSAGLPKGQWYYRVSGYDPVTGESLASREVVAIGGGKVTVKWLAATTTTAATTYNIYRSLAADGRANSEVLIATGVTGTSYVDDGQGQNQFAPGHLSSTAAGGGSFGATPAGQPLTYVVSSVIGSLERVGYPAQILLNGSTETAVQLSWDSVPGATYNLYRFDYGTQKYTLLASALTDASKPFLDTNLTTLATEPPKGEAPLPNGSLSKWSLVPDPTAAGQPLKMAYAREGAEATTLALADGATGVIYAVGGRKAVTDADYLHAVESLLIPLDTGLPTAGWKLQGDGTGGSVVGHPLNHARAFFALMNSQDHDVVPRAPDPKEPPCTDFDGDGYKPCSCFAQSVTLDAAACGAGSINTGNSCDCNDNDPTVYPCAADVCGDGVAQNCIADGTCAATCTSKDADADGHRAISCGGDDCCDSGSETALGCSPANAGGMHPGATEICGDGIDQDCDGVDPACSTGCTTDADGDGYIACSCYPNGAPGTACGAPKCDCNDADPAIHPCASDIACNGVAENCVADGCVILSGQINLATRGINAMQSRASRQKARDLGQLASLKASRPGIAQAVVCAPPVWLIANQGEHAFGSGGPVGSLEACAVDSGTGDVVRCDTAATATIPWTDQTSAPTPSQPYVGLSAQLWDIGGVPTVGSWMGATGGESTTAGPSIANASGNFWNVQTGTDASCNFTPSASPGPGSSCATGYQCAVYGNQSADSKFLPRAFYRTARVAGYVYVVGGWRSNPDGVSGDMERHLQ